MSPPHIGVQEIRKHRRSSVLTAEEAAEIIQRVYVQLTHLFIWLIAYRKSYKRRELSDMFEPLDEEDFEFIKPFALKWKNKSVFSVLMRYRAVKLQDFFNFCQQIHLYNSNAFHNLQLVMDNVDLNELDRDAMVFNWLGENIHSVSKIVFNLNDIPFYDTSYTYDLLTNLGNFEKEDSWDTPYQWRESRLKEVSQTGTLQEEAKSDNPINITYSRHPDDPLIELPNLAEDTEMITENDNETVKGHQTPDSTELKSDDENIETDDSMDADVNINNELNIRNNKAYGKTSKVQKQVALNNLQGMTNDIQHKPLFEKISLRKVEKSDERKYIVNSKPANKDFDYIKAIPVSKPKSSVDPIAELRNISRKK
ncbi:hypothetical protein NQ315_004950 [Exocentrus adspersus]|uniref:Uncharacterized protein n=1 Tax=Exocentrus adspersus TaxID=1586481 RepID=A0AAV8W2V7_9CUCU|nr:hypothetical protein NQ315_004950 [Exocentrus adspersus]